MTAATYLQEMGDTLESLETTAILRDGRHDRHHFHSAGRLREYLPIR
jgi:hypothetical protein